MDYFYDEKAVLEERNAADGSLLAHYNYADRLLSLSTIDGIQYYHHDSLGSTVNLTNPDGNTLVSYTGILGTSFAWRSPQSTRSPGSSGKAGS